MKLAYESPRAEVMEFHLEERFLTESLTTGLSGGENVTLDSEFNPW